MEWLAKCFPGNSLNQGAITKCVDLRPSVTYLLSPADFCLLHATIHKLVLSVLLTKEEKGGKAQLKAMSGSFFLGFQSIDRPSVTQLNFKIGPREESENITK